MKKLLLSATLLSSVLGYSQSITITEIGRHNDSRDGACEISTYDFGSKKIFVTNAASDSIDVIDVSGTTTIYEIEVATNVSLTETKEVDFSVFPNPTNGHISYEGSFVPSLIKVMDTKDYIIHIERNSENTISLEGLKSGIYFLQFIGKKNELVTKRIMKQ